MKKRNPLAKKEQESHAVFNQHKKKPAQQRKKSIKDFWKEPEQDRPL